MSLKTRIAIYAAAIIIIAIALIAFVAIFTPNEEPRRHFSEPFIVVVLPDIQKYSLEGKEDILFSQMNWIVENKESLNIKFAVFEGDLSDQWDNEKLWGDANKAGSILEKNGVPFGLVPGNHDHDDYDPSRPATNFEKYFPFLRFESNSWWGGSFGQTNSYQIINTGDYNFLFLGLDVCPTQEELSWANSIISQNEEKHSVLTTHGYLNEKAERTVHVCGSTEYLWEGLVKNHRNLQIVLSGHVHGEATLVSTNDFGEPVYQMLADYQSYSDGGQGYLRILQFVPDQNLLAVSTYSPYLKKFESDPSSRFDLNYQLN